MKPKSRAPEQAYLLRPRLTDMIDMRHELVRLEGLIDWEFFEREWAGFFPSHTGRPLLPRRPRAKLKRRLRLQMDDCRGSQQTLPSGGGK